MDTFFIFCAQYLIALPVIILGIFFAKSPKSEWKGMAVFALASAILAYLLAKVGGRLFFDPRPFVVGNFTPLIPHAADNGFPSDHALLAAVVASIGLYWNKRLGVSLWLLAILIAFARVYVGVHHAVDVIGSMVIAVVASMAVYEALKLMKEKPKAKQ